MSGTRLHLKSAIGAVCLIAALGTVWAGPAGAVDDEAPTPTVSPSTVVAGGTIAVTSELCFGDSVHVKVGNGTPVSVVPDDEGDWTVAVIIPAATPAGTYDVLATCDFYDGSDSYKTAHVTVTAPTPPAVTISSPGATGTPTVAPGASVPIAATGFTPGERVDATLHSAPVALGSFTADAAGAVSGTVKIPAGTAAGQHSIVLVGATSTRTGTLAIVVSSTGLAKTGRHTTAELALALTVMAAGLLFLGTSLQMPRRRTT